MTVDGLGQRCRQGGRTDRPHPSAHVYRTVPKQCVPSPKDQNWDLRRYVRRKRIQGWCSVDGSNEMLLSFQLCRRGGKMGSIGRNRRIRNAFRGGFRNQHTLPQAPVETGRSTRDLTREVGTPYECFERIHGSCGRVFAFVNHHQRRGLRQRDRLSTGYQKQVMCSKHRERLFPDTPRTYRRLIFWIRGIRDWW